TPTFSDTCDSSLTVSFADTSLPVSGKEVSKTKRTWTAVDDKGNTVSVSQTITVEDTMAPSLTLAGASAMSVLLNGTYVEPGATAFDDCAGTCPVGVVGSVNVT